MWEQNASYLAKHSESTSNKKFKQNLPENFSKSTKIVNKASKFSRFFQGEHAPGPPQELFVFLNQLQICSAKKIRLKQRGNYVPPILNFSLRHSVYVYMHVFTLCFLQRRIVQRTSMTSFR